MNKPEKLAILGTQDTRRRQKKQKQTKTQKKTKKMSNTDPNKNQG